jgi:acyl-CoA thioester hydrolase
MFESTTQIRIHYALVDQMGFVYYGNYAQFFEIGRVEAFRSLGFSYKEVEAMGIIMPVVDYHCKYLRPVKYDEMITVKTIIKDLPLHHKITFIGEVYNEANELCTTCHIVLYMMEKATMHRSKMPEAMLEKLRPFFKD